MISLMAIGRVGLTVGCLFLGAQKLTLGVTGRSMAKTINLLAVNTASNKS